MEKLRAKLERETLGLIDKTANITVTIAIDDFGSEYSSLNRLSKIPFDRIKVDRELVKYIGLERKRAFITEIIILLAKTFDAGITAEGVETKQQAEFLREAACDEVQGYLFSRPLPVDGLEEFLKSEIPERICNN